MSKKIKLIQKIKNWLIIKLGGYVMPSTKIEYKTLQSVPIRATYKERNWSLKSIEEPDKRIVEFLSRIIAGEIVSKKLYTIDTCTDINTFDITHNMTVRVYEGY